MKTKTTISMLALAAIFIFSCTKEMIIHEPGNLVPKTVDQDPSLPSVTVNGAKLHSEAFGHPDSTMIVILHGGPGGDYRGLLNCKKLADHGYRVVFYDQRGSGLSQRFLKESYTSLGIGAIDLMIDDLTGIIAHYKTHANQKVMLLGHSWGAILATAYTGRYPAQIQGLIVGEPGGFKWDDIKSYLEASRAFDLLGESLNDVTYIDQFLTGREDQHQLLDYKLALISGDNEITGEINSTPESFWRSGAVILDAFLEIGEDHNPDFSSGIRQYEKPVLFLYSQQNKAYPDTWAQKISAAYQTVQLKKLMVTGHSGMISDNRIWNQITLPEILNYINSL